MHSYTYFRPLNAEFKTRKVFQKIFLRISNASITASCNIPDVNIVIVPTDGPSLITKNWSLQEKFLAL